MSTTQPTDPTAVDLTGPASDDPEQLRREIESTRADLGDTVAALSEKTDVKAQASAKADELKHKAHEVTDQAKLKAESAGEQVRQNPLPVVAGALLALFVLNKLRRRRKARRQERSRLEDALQHTLSGGVPVAALLVDRSEIPVQPAA